MLEESVTDCVSAPQDPSERKPHILVVDDDEAVRDMLACIFVISGYRVTTAVHGGDAIRCIANDTFDLVLTDWNMPVVDGGRLAIALSAAHLPVPVILMSGSFGAESIPKCVSAAIVATLAKPIAFSTLLSTVASAIESARPAVLDAA